MTNFIHTFFPQQKIQEMVGVSHAHFSLYLGSPQGGVDISWALSLLCLPQFREPTPHVPVEGEIKEREEEKVKPKRMLINI